MLLQSMQNLTTLREIAAANPAEVPALVARLEIEAAEYLLTVRENLDNAPAIILNRLAERYPILDVLRLNPQAELVIMRIVDVLKARQK